MPAEFCIRIILPDGFQSKRQIESSVSVPTSELIDDDPNQPLFLTEACSIFAARGVRFEIIGFFREPLPVSTENDLMYLLESLPSFFEFFEDKSSNQFELGFWGQGIETIFSFSKLESEGVFEINCSPKANFALKRQTERISYLQLVQQVVAVVDVYREALRQFFPQVLDEPWNKKVFAAAARMD